MTASYPTKLILAFKSGNRCALKDCRIKLTEDGVIDDNAVIGEAAHIYGEKAGSARFSAEIELSLLNEYSNLIYLCPTCHTKIDKLELDYPVVLLLQIKEEHEKWVNQQMDNGMSEVTFAELEIASRVIASGNHSTENQFHIISPEEKIKKNNLTQAIRALILSGLSRSGEVRDYLSRQAQLDMDFPEKLKNGFKDKYLEMKKTTDGDSLFYEMMKFAENGKTDFAQRAASLAILCHLFEICEVFEK
jgi:hypothetical protein